jgi:hypothetical protein
MCRLKNKSLTGVTSGAGTAYPSGYQSSPPVFSGVRVTRSLVLYVCFVDLCLSFCTFLFWPLFYLLFFDIQILITPMVSSSSSSNTILHVLTLYIINLYLTKKSLTGVTSGAGAA